MEILGDVLSMWWNQSARPLLPYLPCYCPRMSSLSQSERCTPTPVTAWVILTASSGCPPGRDAHINTSQPSCYWHILPTGLLTNRSGLHQFCSPKQVKSGIGSKINFLLSRPHPDKIFKRYFHGESKYWFSWKTYATWYGPRLWLILSKQHERPLFLTALSMPTCLSLPWGHFLLSSFPLNTSRPSPYPQSLPSWELPCEIAGEHDLWCLKGIHSQEPDLPLKATLS